MGSGFLTIALFSKVTVISNPAPPKKKTNKQMTIGPIPDQKGGMVVTDILLREGTIRYFLSNP